MLVFTLSSLLFVSQTTDDYDFDENCSRTNPHQIENAAVKSVILLKLWHIQDEKKLFSEIWKNRMVTKNII